LPADDRRDGHPLHGSRKKETTMLKLTDPAAATLESWHTMIRSGDLTALPAMLHPDAVFRSPAAFKPYSGAQTVAVILTTVAGVFRNFAYQREFASADGLNVVLEFSASVEAFELKGIDMIRFDADGRIVEFEVMIRPLSALQALAAEMGRRLLQQAAARS
jgi:ketosteroid isomerase-like protein